jgi:hypothetical protein
MLPNGNVRPLGTEAFLCSETYTFPIVMLGNQKDAGQDIFATCLLIVGRKELIKFEIFKLDFT